MRSASPTAMPTQGITHTGPNPDHAHTKPVLPTDHDSQEYSVMSYRRYVGGPTTGNAAADYPQTLMQNDIAALQYMYGADYTTNARGDHLLLEHATTGEMSINGVGQGAPANNRVFLTIWDGGGVDTYDFSNYTTNLTVDLSPGGWTTVDAAQLALLGADDGTNQFARGNIANALLYRGDMRSLIENAIGGSGNDVITGNDAANVLNGGTGADGMEGGRGNDSYYVDNVGDAVIEFNGQSEGTDHIYAAISFSMSEGTEFLTLLEDARALSATGTFGRDTISGNSFDNVLNGSGEQDSMLGRRGNDTYHVDHVWDMTVEAVNEGLDTVVSSVDWTLAHDTENLTLTGSAVFGIGNELDNTIVGGVAGNHLNGGLGRDLLRGGLGDDIYILDDTAFVSYDAEDSFDFLYDIVEEAAGGGSDTVGVQKSSYHTGYTLGANIENGVVRGAARLQPDRQRARQRPHRQRRGQRARRARRQRHPGRRRRARHAHRRPRRRHLRPRRHDLRAVRRRGFVRLRLRPGERGRRRRH